MRAAERAKTPTTKMTDQAARAEPMIANNRNTHGEHESIVTGVRGVVPASSGVHKVTPNPPKEEKRQHANGKNYT